MKNQTGTILISNLEVFAKHGVLPEETSLGQKFIVSAAFQCDFSKPGKSDDLGTTINYAEAAQIITEFLQKNTFQLIETAAWQLAEYLLLKYAPADAVEITIKKPWAPVHLPMDTVSVSVKREWSTAFLSIGSNMGDKKAYLDKSVVLLEEDEKIKVECVSDYIITEPWGPVVQEDFLNGAVKLRTLYEPEELLSVLNQIEQKLDRKRTIHWGPRTIDLDIIFYDDLVLTTEKLTIPHKEMASRMFVLAPLCQIAPDYMHPIMKKTVWELKENCR